VAANTFLKNDRNACKNSFIEKIMFRFNIQWLHVHAPTAFAHCCIMQFTITTAVNNRQSSSLAAQRIPADPAGVPRVPTSA
jgi:hypothetical protein